MRFQAKHALTLGWALALAACSGLVVMDYKPSSLIQGDGSVRLGRFDYSPQGKVRIEPNQVEDTLFMPVYLDQPVASYVRKAFALELKFAGFNTHDPESVTMFANIRKLESDHISVGINWTMIVDYSFAYNGDTVYGRTVTTKIHSSKVNAPFEAINKIIRISFEQIMTDPVVKKLLHFAPGDIRMMMEGEPEKNTFEEEQRKAPEGLPAVPQ